MSNIPEHVDEHNDFVSHSGGLKVRDATHSGGLEQFVAHPGGFNERETYLHLLRDKLLDADIAAAELLLKRRKIKRLLSEKSPIRRKAKGLLSEKSPTTALYPRLTKDLGCTMKSILMKQRTTIQSDDVWYAITL